MKFIYQLFITLFTCGFLQVSQAQIFVGLGATVQQVSVVDNYNPDRYSAFGSFSTDYEKVLLNISPALNWELVVSKDFFVSSSLSYLWASSHRTPFPQIGDALFEPDEAIIHFSAMAGQVSVGYAFKSFGLELGVEGIQSVKNERSESLLRAFQDPIVFTEPLPNEPFLHFYPRIALSYKYGRLLAVASATFRQDDFIVEEVSDFSPRLRDSQRWNTAPSSTLSLSIYHVWQVSSGKQSLKARF